MRENSQYQRAWTHLFLAWLVAFVAFVGSLFFSEIMNYVPCNLCWYQRIAMYPLVAVILLGLFPVQKSVFRYAFPLAAVGWLISAYHNLLMYEILPENISPCRQGISCTAQYINWGGFVTIPLLALVAFTLILGFLILARRSLRDEK